LRLGRVAEMIDQDPYAASNAFNLKRGHTMHCYLHNVWLARRTSSTSHHTNIF
jgi:hypothetical protein